MGRHKLSTADLAFRHEVASKFRDAMRDRGGLDQTQAARELGVTKQAISQYLLERATPSSEVLARACAKWKVTLKYRSAEFTSGAFGAQETKTRVDPEDRQLNLFKEPQVFVNPLGEVTIERTRKGDLHVTVSMKKATLPPVGRRRRKAS